MSEAANLNFWDRFGLFIQDLAGKITFPVWGSFFFFLIRVVGRYRIERIQEIRKQYQQLIKTAQGPIILCANHLTKIDSALITWSLGSIWSYFRSFSHFSWNLPERSRYFSNRLLRIICYLGKCIPIDRGGERDLVNHSLDKIRYLLKKRNVVTIFPEGKRSLDGKIDAKDYSYGVGKLIGAIKDCKVVCIYLRGYGQKKFSSIPRLGEKFYVEMKQIQPSSVHQGIRAARDLAEQIINQLRCMEENYFALCRQ